VLLGSAPNCFCDHCLSRAVSLGINIDRARQGWKEFYDFIQDAKLDRNKPADGYFVTFMRLIMEYPEISAWDKMWYDAQDEHRRLIFGLVKAIDPSKEVGWHLVHGITYDPMFRARTAYSRFVNCSDYIKPLMYFDCAAPRSKGFFEKAFSSSLLKDFSKEEGYRIFTIINQFDPDTEPSYSAQEKEPLPASADYVYRETKRCIAGVGPNVKVYPGLGFDVPTQKVRVSEKEAYESTKAAFEAGAHGVVIPREWHEARIEILGAAGKAIKERL
jgi:hypothetical protein